jgi:hypothetical protein
MEMSNKAEPLEGSAEDAKFTEQQATLTVDDDEEGESDSPVTTPTEIRDAVPK